MRLLRTGVTTSFHPAGEFVGRAADAPVTSLRPRALLLGENACLRQQFRRHVLSQ
jgi:hypothetical protein